MDYSEILEKYLYRIARGEIEDVKAVLPLFLKTNVYVGGNLQAQSGGGVSLSLGGLRRGNAEYVPVYLKRKNKHGFSSSNESRSSDQSVELFGEALIRVLPAGIGVIIEPSTSLEVIFSPEVLSTISPEDGSLGVVEPNSGVADNNRQLNEPAIRNNEGDQSLAKFHRGRGKETEVTERDLWLKKSDIPSNEEDITGIDEKSESEFEFGRGLFTGHDEDTDASAEGNSQKVHNVNVAQVEESLTNIFQDYAEVAEGFLLEHESPESELVVGVLISTEGSSETWSSDRRFDFADRISNIARHYYGYPSAIEIYDDLHDTGARSWELFKVLSPFYVRETAVQGFSDKFKHSTRNSSFGYPSENVSGKRLRAREEDFSPNLADNIEVEARKPRERNPTSGRLGLRESFAKIGSAGLSSASNLAGSRLGSGLKLFSKQSDQPDKSANKPQSGRTIDRK